MFGRHAAVLDPDDVLQWNSTLSLVVEFPDIQPRCLRSGSRGPERSESRATSAHTSTPPGDHNALLLHDLHQAGDKRLRCS